MIKFLNIKILIYFLFFLSINVKSQIYINEFLSSNTLVNYDPDYTMFTDWIEIYNDSDKDINIEDYFLTDDSLNKTKWRIPCNTIIRAKNYYIFWADGLNKKNHLNFSLSKKGEFIGLYKDIGIEVDKITYHKQESDISYGRRYNNLNEWGYFYNPTPGKKNNSKIYKNIKRAKNPIFSVKGGVYSSSQIVELHTKSKTAEIRYTLNGTNPKESSLLYTKPLIIDSTTNLRARCFEEKLIPSKIVTNTYLIGIKQNLPIISITTEPKNLYNDTIGIYCIGVNGKTGYGITANYWNRDWERPANIELFEKDGKQKINQLIGIQINGERRNMGQKSLRIFARSKYGKSSLNYNIFNNGINKFKSIVLRNGGVPDYSHSIIRDNFVQNIIKDKTDIDAQSNKMSVVYINGKYFGIYSIKEKLNEDYLASHHKINTKKVDILENENKAIIEGNNDSYLYMMQYLRTNKTTDNYNFINKNIDITSFLDYIITEIYISNYDWPTINIKYWKEQKETKKWRWLLFDVDASFMNKWGGYNRNSIKHAFRDDGPNWPNSPKATELNRLLISNERIKNQFIQKFAAHANTTFKSKRILHILDSIKTIINPEILNHINRWKNVRDVSGNSIQSISDWENSINDIKIFANNRWKAIRKHIIKFFNISGCFNLTTNTNNGIIKIYDVPINTGIDTGKYFVNIPIRLKAVPKLGYKFAKWKGASSSTSTEIELRFNKDTFITAIFEPNNRSIISDTITTDTLFYNKSPYIVINDLIIPKEKTLYIEAGVKIYMPKKKSIYVYGNVIISGTKKKPVIFNVNKEIENKEWGALCFYNSTDSSSIKYLQIKNTTTGKNKKLQKAAISIFNSTVYISNSVITKCYQPIYAEKSNVYILNTKLECEFTCDNVNIKDTKIAVIRNCDIKGNEAPDTDGIDFDNVSYGIIKNNKIYSFKGTNSDGVDIGENSNVLIEQNNIFNCNDKGISVGQASKVKIINNIILNCNIGIGVKDSLSFAQIENNTIYNTNYGVYCFEKNYLSGGGSANIINTIISNSNIYPVFYDKKSNVTTSYSCSDTKKIAGKNNINSYPLFVDTLHMNFNLQKKSPCIKAGYNTIEKKKNYTIGANFIFNNNTTKENIVINEINYNSHKEYNSGNWIELYNNTNDDVDLSGWIFTDNNNKNIYKIPDGLILKAHKYIVFCNDWIKFVKQYPFTTNFRGNFKFGLRNSGDKLRLYNSKMKLIDFVEYSNKQPWPINADGKMPTLELKYPYLNNNKAENWNAKKVFGTPGKQNSNFLNLNNK